MLVYKILRRITNKRRVVGYELLGSDNKEYRLSKDKVIELLKMGIIINACFNEHTGGIEGIGVDLRCLENIDITEINKDKRNKSKLKKNNSTNYELAERYKEKVQLLGKESDIEFKYMANDRVRLESVTNKSKKLVVPSFITDIKDGVFNGSTYEEIYINNSSRRKFKANGLFRDMLTERLKVVFRHPECIVNMREMFRGCKNLKTLDLSGFCTRGVVDMAYMFYMCYSLERVDLSGVDLNKVEDMRCMFELCNNIKEIDLGKTKTRNLKYMVAMFNRCHLLRSIDLSNFSTSMIIDMSDLFNDCKSLAKVDIGNFDTSNVRDMTNMFKGCESLDEIDVSSWDMSNVEKINYMFSGCKRLKKIDVTNWDVSSVEGKLESVFNGCESLEVIDMHKWDLGGVTGIFRLLYGCKSLKSVVLSGINTYWIRDMQEIFSGCISLREVDVSKVRLISLQNIHDMFKNCGLIKELDLRWLDYLDKRESYNGSAFIGCNSLELVRVNSKNKVDIGRVLARDNIDCEIEYEE